MTLRCNLIDYGEGDKKVKVVRGVREKLKVVMIVLTINQFDFVKIEI